MAITNENAITSAFVRQFADTYEIATQQKESRFLSTILNEGTVVGSSFTINDLGTIAFGAAAANFTATVGAIPTAGTRVVTMSDYSSFQFLSPNQLAKLKADPTDSYLQALVAGRNRTIDNVIYSALIGSVQRKTVEADSGLAGVALPAGQIILAGGTVITKAKLIAARALFYKNEVDSDEELYIVYNSEMLATILADTTLTSADFMAVQMLQSGNVSGKWLGFNWIHFEGLANGAGGATEYRTVAYAKSACRFGESTIVPLDITTRNDLNMTKQVGGIFSYGAGRTNETKVVAIDFLKAV